MAITFGSMTGPNPGLAQGGITIPGRGGPTTPTLTPEQQRQLEYEKQRAAQEAEQRRRDEQEQSQVSRSQMVPSMAGPYPVTQPAYESQALTQLQQQGARDRAADDRTGNTALAQLQATSAANLAQQQAAAEAALQAASFAGQKGLLGERARLGEQAFGNRLSSLTGAMGGLTSTNVDFAGGSGAQEDAARSAAFAREKDRIGQIGRGALDSLINLMSERGVSGGGYEQQGIANIIGGAQGQLGDVAREQTLQDLDQARQVASQRYSGGIAQRGQDMQMKQALLALMNAGPLY